MPLSLLIFSGLACSLDECDQAHDQGAITACAAQAYDRQDERLNAAYNAALKNPENDGPAITTAERAWIAYRDAACPELDPMQYGSAGAMDTALCRADETKKRASLLEKLPSGHR